MRILHVDANEVDRQALTRALWRMSRSYVLKQVGTMKEALEYIEHRTPDLILLDLDLPDCDDPVSTIKGAFPGLSSALVVITGMDAARAWDMAQRHEVYLKRQVPSLLERAGAILPALCRVPM